MRLTLLLVSHVLHLKLLLELFVVLRHLLRALVNVLRNLLVLLKLKLDFFLGICLLGQHHTPSLQIVKCLILVGLQVTLNQSAVAQRHLLTFALDGPASRRSLHVSQRYILVFLLRLSTLRIRVLPLVKLGRMHRDSSEEQRKDIQEFTLGRWRFNVLPIFGEG